MTITRPPITHVEVLQANAGEQVFGIKTGQLLTVHQVTPCFIFAKSFSGREIKISKKTKRACRWGSPSTSPVFNV
jgi:hypothetical protein